MENPINTFRIIFVFIDFHSIHHSWLAIIIVIIVVAVDVVVIGTITIFGIGFMHQAIQTAHLGFISQFKCTNTGTIIVLIREFRRIKTKTIFIGIGRETGVTIVAVAWTNITKWWCR